MDPTPEQLLGLPVVERGGRQLGVVVDVGLATWRQPKFLLVRPPGNAPSARFLRVEYGQVEEVGLDGVLVAPPGALPRGLPA
jgi:sporulation protein YlmC with PRC-barrel domain